MRIIDWRSDVCSSDLAAAVIFGVFYKGMGARVSAKYDSGSTVVGGSAGDLNFGDLATFNLRFFMDFNQQPKMLKSLPFLNHPSMRLSELGRASFSERLCRYVYISVVAVTLKKK